ncbi:uncharacterized protein LOC134188350 [Corticium candelabrum]|uniref:uncharacterized protein LOC134188350 n=1 Tax=Corticium candelabrum TaxID=121492 RepID=UPI002E273F62|nr:uncharacterized protein LOC134188350 [Corticium candelabrum]
MSCWHIVEALLVASAFRIITRASAVVTGPVEFLNLPYEGYITANAVADSPVYRLNSEGSLVPLQVQISNAPKKTQLFTLTGTKDDLDKFKIDENAGNVTLKTASPQVNTTVKYIVFGIRRSLIGFSIYAHVTTELTVMVVVDLNSHSPRFSDSSYMGHVAYDAAIGYEILNVSATDGDKGTSGQIFYTIDGGNDKKIFRLGSNSGLLTIERDLSDNSLPTYNLVVKAEDRGVPVRFSTASVIIRVMLPTTTTPTITVRATTSHHSTSSSNTPLVTTESSTTSQTATGAHTTKSVTTTVPSTRKSTTQSAKATTQAGTTSIASTDSPTTVDVTSQISTTATTTGKTTTQLSTGSEMSTRAEKTETASPTSTSERGVTPTNAETSSRTVESTSTSILGSTSEYITNSSVPFLTVTTTKTTTAAPSTTVGSTSRAAMTPVVTTQDSTSSVRTTAKSTDTAVTTEGTTTLTPVVTTQDSTNSIPTTAKSTNTAATIEGTTTLTRVITTQDSTSSIPTTAKSTTTAVTTEGTTTLYPTTNAPTTTSSFSTFSSSTQRSTTRLVPSTEQITTPSSSSQAYLTTDVFTTKRAKVSTDSQPTTGPSTDKSTTNLATTRLPTHLPSTAMQVTATPLSSHPTKSQIRTADNTKFFTKRSESNTASTVNGKSQTLSATPGQSKTSQKTVVPSHRGSSGVTPSVSTQSNTRKSPPINQENTSTEALPAWALVLIPTNLVIVVFGFLLLIFVKCRKNWNKNNRTGQRRNKDNSFLDGWLTTQLDYLSRASREGPSPNDDYEQHTPFYGEPWEIHNRLNDIEFEASSLSRQNTQNSRKHSRNSRKSSDRSQKKDSRGQDVEGDRLEYVGEWSEVVGSRLTSPLFSSPETDRWQDNSLYVPSQNSPMSVRQHTSSGIPGAYSTMVDFESDNRFFTPIPQTVDIDYADQNDPLGEYAQSSMSDTWQEYEYRPTLTRIAEESDDENPAVDDLSRPLSFVSGTASDRRSKRTQLARFSPPVAYLNDYESSTDDLSDVDESGDAEDRRYYYRTPKQSVSQEVVSGISSSTENIVRLASGVPTASTDSDREIQNRKDSRLLVDALTWHPPEKQLSLKEALVAWHAGQEQDCSHL